MIVQLKDLLHDHFFSQFLCIVEFFSSVLNFQICLICKASGCFLLLFYMLNKYLIQIIGGKKGVSLCFFAECPVLKLPASERTPLPYLLTLIPPLFLSLLDPEIFFKALDFAGTYGGMNTVYSTSYLSLIPFACLLL